MFPSVSNHSFLFPENGELTISCFYGVWRVTRFFRFFPANPLIFRAVGPFRPYLIIQCHMNIKCTQLCSRIMSGKDFALPLVVPQGVLRVASFSDFFFGLFFHWLRFGRSFAP